MGFFIDFIFILATLYFHSIKLKKTFQSVRMSSRGDRPRSHIRRATATPHHPNLSNVVYCLFNKINNRVFSWCIDTNVNSYILTAKRLPFDKLSTFKSTNSFCTSPLGKSTAPRICTLWVGSYSLPFIFTAFFGEQVHYHSSHL